MKLWIIMLVVILSIIFGGLYMENFILKTTNRLSESLDQVKDAVKNDRWSEAMQHRDKIDEEWNTQRKVWDPFIHNHDLDTIVSHLSRLKVFVDTQEKPLALAEITMLEIELMKLHQQEVLTLQNIL